MERFAKYSVNDLYCCNVADAVSYFQALVLPSYHFLFSPSLLLMLLPFKNIFIKFQGLFVKKYEMYVVENVMVNAALRSQGNTFLSLSILPQSLAKAVEELMCHNCL